MLRDVLNYQESPTTSQSVDSCLPLRRHAVVVLGQGGERVIDLGLGELDRAISQRGALRPRPSSRVDWDAGVARDNLAPAENKLRRVSVLDRIDGVRMVVRATWVY